MSIHNLQAISSDKRAFTGIVLFLLFVFSVVVRLTTAEYFENGGDCVGVWLYIRQLVAGYEVVGWNHHSMRWGMILPLWLIGKGGGLHPVFSYVMPIFYASVASVFICLIGKRLHSIQLGIVASLLFILYPQMPQTGSQIWPGVFELTYVSVSIYTILVWLDSKKRQFLVFAAIAFCLAWASRVTAVYFFPGILLLIWLPSRDWRAVFFFCVAVALILGGELLWFYWDSGNVLGRVGLIKSTHGSQDELLISVKGYLLHFLKFKKLRGLLGVVVICLAAAVGIMKSHDKRFKALGFLFVIHLVLQVWMISGLNPLKLAQPVGARYYCVLAPFGLMCLLLFLSRFETHMSWLKRGVVIVLLVAFAAFSVKKIPTNNSVFQITNDATLVGEAFDNAGVILMHYTPWEPGKLEATLIAALGGKKRNHDVDEDEVLKLMHKNRRRMLVLFEKNLDEVLARFDGSPVRLERYRYSFGPPSGSMSNSGVEVLFGRKEFKAVRK